MILPAGAAGGAQLAFPMTEPGAGSDAAAMSTTAASVDGGFLLSGDKTYITGASTAEEFITEREQFGKKIKGFQTVQHAVVEAHTLTAGMKLFLAGALRAYGTGGDSTRAISTAKYFCSEQLQRVVEVAVRVGGGRSYFDSDPVSRHYQEAPCTPFAGGTVEVQKMLIARTLGV